MPPGKVRPRLPRGISLPRMRRAPRTGGETCPPMAFPAQRPWRGPTAPGYGRPARAGGRGRGRETAGVHRAFRHQVSHDNALRCDSALHKVYFVAQVGFNYAEMSVLELTLCHAGLCFHTYPRIDLHFSFFLTRKLRRGRLFVGLKCAGTGTGSGSGKPSGWP